MISDIIDPWGKFKVIILLLLDLVGFPLAAPLLPFDRLFAGELRLAWFSEDIYSKIRKLAIRSGAFFPNVLAVKLIKLNCFLDVLLLDVDDDPHQHHANGSNDNSHLVRCWALCLS